MIRVRHQLRPAHPAQGWPQRAPKTRPGGSLCRHVYLMARVSVERSDASGARATRRLKPRLAVCGAGFLLLALVMSIGMAGQVQRAGSTVIADAYEIRGSTP